MKRLKIKINFECTHADKKETEMELEKIIHYHIYEKIWNIDPKGVKLDVKEIAPQFNNLLDMAYKVYLDFTTYDDCHEYQMDAENRKVRLTLQYEAWKTLQGPFALARGQLEREFRKALGFVEGQQIRELRPERGGE